MATHAIRICFDISNDDMRAIENVTQNKISIEDWLYQNLVSSLERMKAYEV